MGDRPDHLLPRSCSLCGQPAQLVARPSFVRRGERTTPLTRWGWWCPACEDPFEETDTVGFGFVDHDLMVWNEELAAKVWEARFGEPLPASERSRLHPREVRVPVLLTADEANRLDAARGDVPRSEFLRRAIPARRAG